ncbi:hypothetical protein CAC42_1802 [Sphaceloma murrayae]|uniref:Uncharacterized protein n=1 Tax=Sphaceloma murrayae TaxID=2082308 RepID=A0A2K1QVI1_9PEZI|nr:hypothetical protein CAC42_1802 [Sphaceloma murrayae]
MSSRKSSSRSSGPVPVRDHRSSTTTSSSSSSSSSRRSHYSSSSSSSSYSSASKYTLTPMSQLPANLPVNYPFQPSFVISRRRSSSHSSSSSSSSSRKTSSSSSTSSKTSPLLASISLLTRSSEPLPAGHLTGPRLVSSIHDLPPDYRASLPEPLRSEALGYVSFPELKVRREGVVRLGVVVWKMPEGARGRETGREAVKVGEWEGAEVGVYCHPGFRG